jgi:hypothetical protein
LILLKQNALIELPGCHWAMLLNWPKVKHFWFDCSISEVHAILLNKSSLTRIKEIYKEN